MTKHATTAYVLLFAALLFVFVTTAPAVTRAQDEEINDDVILLAPSVLPPSAYYDSTVGEGDEERAVTRVRGLGEYLNGAFLLGIGIASALAVIYITVGGVQYMVAAAAGKKEAGREKILAAVGGLVLALGAFVILNTINPDLLRFDIEAAIQRIVAQIEEDRGPLILAKGDRWCIEQGLAARKTLERVTNGRVQLNRNKECQYVGDGACTSLAGIHPSFWSAIEGITSRSNCRFIINGGTEFWLHGKRSTDIRDTGTAHMPGNAVFDINADVCINQYILGGTLENVLPPPAGCLTPIERDGVTYKWESGTCPGSTGDHWHVELFVDPNLNFESVGDVCPAPEGSEEE